MQYFFIFLLLFLSEKEGLLPWSLLQIVLMPDAKSLQRQATSLGEKERADIYDMPAYSQSLDWSERCKEPFADGLQFVVIKR